MEDKDYIKDLFNEKLNSFEANVRPELWTNISSQLGATAATSAATGLSLLAKTIIGLSIAAAVGGVTFFALKDKKQEKAIPSESDTLSLVKEENKNKEEELKTINNKVEQSTPVSNNENTPANKLIVPKYNYTWVEPIYWTSVTPIENNVIENENTNSTTSVNSDENTTQTETESTTSSTSENTQTTNSTVENDAIETNGDNAIGKLTNIFTPNGDRVNDYLSVESEGLQDFSIVVIDQNSKIVYQSTEANFMWDGIGMNGDMVATGNYVYYITARDSKGNLITKHSVLRIER